ncbi:ATP-binding protein [Porcincola intestinalis]|uniref:ATP-binding protein n=1 Tax=Porcincola intestinalis TaxID=2606632 RepID=A0A6L5X3G8_9FIRM|nr:ATP-binding protein [Porcincola intestinalis]MCI6697816.1 ATP-binding protein [Lachnospiraceae bacterium]MSS13898.1 ATP-binding protein [Porcincola intestinalis]
MNNELIFEDNNELKVYKEVCSLIRLKQEGDYWDFKKQWYVKRNDKGHDKDHVMHLLIDIICMANNLVNRDTYIIIGVDEENDFSIHDISEDKNRLNTQKIVDILKDKPFAGGRRPVVTVEPICIHGITIDVIVIHNSMNTPFYLSKDFLGIKAANIYTRIQNTNTPIDRTADDQYVEYLWKKRFGLLLSPLEKVEYYLQRKDCWEQSPVYDNVKYYRYAPEYTIQYSYDDPEERNGYEYYLLNQVDARPSWTVIEIKYHQTVLKNFDAVFLDGGRHFSPVPEMDGISFNEYGSWDFSYRYWVRESFSYIVHVFYFDRNNYEARIAEERFLENVLIFESEEEHKSFNKYVTCRWKKDSKRIAPQVRKPFVPDISGYNMDVFKKEIQNTEILQYMLSEFRTLTEEI